MGRVRVSDDKILSPTRHVVNKAVKNYMKSATAMRNGAHDKEIEAAHLENELSRIRVDTLNTEAHNVQLREMMGKQLGELKDKVRVSLKPALMSNGSHPQHAKPTPTPFIPSPEFC